MFRAGALWYKAMVSRPIGDSYSSKKTHSSKGSLRGALGGVGFRYKKSQVSAKPGREPGAPASMGAR